jgi:hypothetical protein
VTLEPDQGIAIQPGDRFVQVFPPGKATLEVESHLDAEHVAVRRDTGARQVFPISTLLNPRYWEPAALDQKQEPDA